MDRLLHDLRYGIRKLLKTRQLTLAATACIGLGIASAVFMFTLINGVLLRRPPFPEADRLTRVRLLATEGEGGQGNISYIEFQELRERARSFDAVEMVGRLRFPMTSTHGTERLRGEAVSAGYFDLVGAKAALGRLFAPEDHSPSAPRSVVIGDALWKRTFGSDPRAVGQSLVVRGGTAGTPERSYTIIGVLPPGFVGTVDLDISEFWVPMASNPLPVMLERRDVRNVWPLLRLRPGVAYESARAEIAALGRQLAAADPNLSTSYEFQLERFGETWRGDVRNGFVMLMLAAGLLLLLACINVAGLLLARLAQRRNELTLRFVLGASRGSVVRQLLIESVLLSALGGAVGIALAFWGIRLFAATESIHLPPYVSLAPDWRVVAFASTLVLVTGVLFGVFPARLAARFDAAQQLREAARGVSLGRRQRRFGETLVALEVAFAFVVVITGMLMVRTYVNLSGSEVGYRTANVARLAVTLDATEYADSLAQTTFADRAKAVLRAQPGVRDVTFMAGVLVPHDDGAVAIALDGAPSEPLRNVPRHAVDGDFLRVLDIPLMWGRDLAPSDRRGTPGVTLVSQSLARFIAGGDGRNALGRRLQFVRNAQTEELTEPLEIVGIVADIQWLGPRPVHAGSTKAYDTYVSIYQFPARLLSTAVVTQGDPAAMLASLQRELAALAPTSPVHWVSTMEEELASQYTDVRFYTYLTAGYSTCALLLAAFGIYGVLANAVSRRFSELGIRIAVGARDRHIIGLVLGQGMWALLVGLMIGAGIALGLGRLVASVLYGVSPGDPLTFGAVAGILVMTGLVACYVPARRAMRIDPVVVLHQQ